MMEASRRHARCRHHGLLPGFRFAGRTYGTATPNPPASTAVTIQPELCRRRLVLLLQPRFHQFPVLLPLPLSSVGLRNASRAGGARADSLSERVGCGP